MKQLGTKTSTAIILGATGGVGSTLARLLASQGWKLALTGRDTRKLEDLAAELSCFSQAFDATDPASLKAFFGAAMEELGSLSGVAHCVGSLHLKPAHLTRDEEWADTISRNLTSAFYVVREATAAMRQSGGSIALVSSVAAGRGLVNHEAIAAAKAGVEGLARSAAATYARQGIRVNCVAPGLTETPLTAGITGNELAMKSATAMHPIGRAGKAEEVAAALAWLLSPSQGWVTGQTIAVDGGLSTVQVRATVSG